MKYATDRVPSRDELFRRARTSYAARVEFLSTPPPANLSLDLRSGVCTLEASHNGTTPSANSTPPLAVAAPGKEVSSRG